MLKYFLKIFIILLCFLSTNSLAETIKPSKKPDQPFVFNSPTILIPESDSYVDLQLSEKDAKTYSIIFKLQENGDWYQADTFIESLENKSLMGHILYQRYMHPTKYNSSFDELEIWLKKYHDHPNANLIYALAEKKNPNKKHLLKKNSNYRYIYPGIVENYGCYPYEYKRTKWRSEENWDKVKKFQREIKLKLKNTMPTKALERMDTSPTAKDVLDKVEYDLLLTNIASGYLYVGKSELALETAERALERSGEKVDEAYWVAGLAAWKLGNLDLAETYFTKLYNFPDCDPWKRTAAAYWNARMYKEQGSVSKKKHWLKQATKFPATFYGLLASEELGYSLDINLKVIKFKKEHFNTIIKTSEGMRAIYLINAGQIELAEQELMGLNLRDDIELQKAVLALVSYTNMSQMSLILGSYLKPEDDKYDRYDYAIYPMIPWEPENGFKLDRALIYAFIKQESRFKPDAESRTGALGLMQIMPATAEHITGKPYTKSYYKNKLLKPEHNMKLGQKYLQILLNNAYVDNSLIMLPIAYNSGPGTLKMWLEKEDKSLMNDPLLFIETIPYKETRTFVKKVLANYWIYKKLLDERDRSIDQIIEGYFPKLD